MIRRWLSIAAAAAVAFTAGWLAGESPDWIGMRGVLLSLTLMPIVVFVGALVLLGRLRLSRWTRVLLAIAIGLAFGGGVLGGSARETTAYNACLADGLFVQQQLESFAARHRRYPKTLRELNVPLPCKRALRGTLLQYASDGPGYRLWFTDSFVSHEAKEKSRGFFASK